MKFTYYCPECESELEYEIEMIDEQQQLSGPEACGNCHTDIDDDRVMEEFESEMGEGG